MWYLGSPYTSGPTVALSFPSVIWSWSGSLGGTWGNVYRDSWCGWSGTSWLVCNSSAVRMLSLECPGPFNSYFTITVKYQQQNVPSSLSSSTFLTSQQFSWFSKDCGLTDQALLILCSAKNSLTIWHALGITDFRIQRARDRLSSFKLSSVICLG